MTDSPKDESKPTTVEWRGLTLSLPPINEMDLDVIEAFEDGKAVSAVRAAYGPDQWAQIKAKQPKVGDLEELAGMVAEALGFTSLGE